MPGKEEEEEEERGGKAAVEESGGEAFHLTPLTLNPKPQNLNKS